MKIWGVWGVVAIIMLAGCGGAAAPTATPAPEPTRTAELQRLVLRTLPPRNWVGAPVAHVEAYPGYIDVSFAINTASTPRQMREQALVELTNMAQALSQVTDNAQDLRFEGLFPLVDKYGKQDMSTLLTVWLEPSTLQKINWSNFDPENLSKVADFYLELPALRRNSFGS